MADCYDYSRFVFYQNTQKSNFHSVLQLLATYFCINAINLSQPSCFSTSLFQWSFKDMRATSEQKSPKVSLAEKTKPTAWNVKIKEGKIKVSFRVLVASYV